MSALMSQHPPSTFYPKWCIVRKTWNWKILAAVAANSASYVISLNAPVIGGQLGNPRGFSPSHVDLGLDAR